MIQCKTCSYKIDAGKTLSYFTCATCQKLQEAEPKGKMETSRVQQVTKDEDTHRYASPKDADPNETYNTTEEHLSDWMKEYRRLGEALENMKEVSGDTRWYAFAWSVMDHINALRRV